MLRIRFSRTGKTGQPSFRIVVAEKSAPVKGRYLENLGHYLPARSKKEIVLNKERISYWISKGALPTDTVASLLKRQGWEGMEKYLEPRNKQRKNKGESASANKSIQTSNPEAGKPSEPAVVSSS